jgi:uncharacterized repeat protein (TIGR01451 family)
MLRLTLLAFLLAAFVPAAASANHGNDSDSDDGGLPAARAALALTLSDTTTISPGDTATLTARVTNAGPSDATGVQVALPLPGGRILVRIRAVTRGGRPIAGTRAYQTCTVKRPTVKPPRV